MDHLAILTLVKQRVTSKQDAAEIFESVLRRAVADTAEEVGLGTRKLGNAHREPMTNDTVFIVLCHGKQHRDHAVLHYVVGPKPSMNE